MKDVVELLLMHSFAESEGGVHFCCCYAESCWDVGSTTLHLGSRFREVEGCCHLCSGLGIVNLTVALKSLQVWGLIDLLD